MIILSVSLNQNWGACTESSKLPSMKYHKSAFSSYRIVIREQTLGQTRKKSIEAFFKTLVW
jgi:hypothetical protein